MIAVVPPELGMVIRFKPPPTGFKVVKVVVAIVVSVVVVAVVVVFEIVVVVFEVVVVVFEVVVVVVLVVFIKSTKSSTICTNHAKRVGVDRERGGRWGGEARAEKNC